MENNYLVKSGLFDDKNKCSSVKNIAS